MDLATYFDYSRSVLQNPGDSMERYIATITIMPLIECCSNISYVKIIKIKNRKFSKQNETEATREIM